MQRSVGGPSAAAAETESWQRTPWMMVVVLFIMSASQTSCLLAAQFGVRTVQPIVTPFVQELTGTLPSLATLAGFAFSITGVADLVASPFLAKRSDSIGYRRVLLISLFGAAIATLPPCRRHWSIITQRLIYRRHSANDERLDRPSG
jgi:MFS family permease